MAGDEIVADWLGNVYGISITSTAAVQRLSSVSLRFRSVNLNNFHNVNSVYIGKYYASSATFTANAFFLLPLENIHFEYVDLHELGFRTYLNPTDLRILGINEY